MHEPKIRFEVPPYRHATRIWDRLTKTCLLDVCPGQQDLAVRLCKLLNMACPTRYEVRRAVYMNPSIDQWSLVDEGIVRNKVLSARFGETWCDYEGENWRTTFGVLDLEGLLSRVKDK